MSTYDPGYSAQSGLVYRSVELSVRPPRVALFWRKNEQWQQSAARMLECFSRTWGGAGNICIPVDDLGEIAPAFWHILEAYDPDVLGLYYETRRHRQLADPQEFERRLDQEAGPMASKTGQSLEDTKRGLTDERFMREPEIVWHPSARVKRRSLRYLAPQHYGDALFSHHFTADDAPPHGLVDMAEVAGIERAAVALLDTSALPASLQLMVKIRTGDLAPTHQEMIEKRGAAVVKHPVLRDQLEPLLEVCWQGAANPNNRALLRKICQEAGEPVPDEPAWSGDGPPSEFPFSRTLLGCARMYPPPYTPWGTRPYLVVVGDSADDFAFALACDRMSGGAVWLPKEFLSHKGTISQDVVEGLGKFLAAMASDRNQERQIRLLSLSINEEELKTCYEAIQATFNESPWAKRVTLRMTSPSKIMIPKVHCTIFDEEAQQIPKHYPFVDGEVVVAIETPIPSAVRLQQPYQQSWYVDVRLPRYELPVRDCLCNAVISSDSVRTFHLRPSKDGLSYNSQLQGFLPSGRLEDMVARPKIRLPRAKEVFERLFDASGFRTEHSQAGRFTLGALDLWGGPDAVSADLLNPSTNDLVHSYLAETPSWCRDGDDRGVFLEGTRRRYLSFDDIKKVGSLDGIPARCLVDDYAAKGILARGLILQCSRCAWSAWYAAEQIGQTFRCSRCRAQNRVAVDAWKQPIDEPKWYYDLAEVVYQALKHNFRAPILALRRLKQRAHAFDFSPELDVYSKEKRIGDIDILVLRDGKIVIGEAKTISHLETKPDEEESLLKKWVRFADAATADEVVFATTEPDWSERTQQAIAKAFEGQRPTVALLTARELIPAESTNQPSA